MRRALCLLIVGVLAACGTLSGGGGAGVVDGLHLFGLPITLNLNGQPGADGFAVRIFVTKSGSAKGVPISEGSIEALMFDGVVRYDEILTNAPTQKWSFNAKQLMPFRERSQLGDGYRLVLRWNEAPKHGHITVIARYLPPKDRPPIYSSPSTITSAIQ